MPAKQERVGRGLGSRKPPVDPAPRPHCNLGVRHHPGCYPLIPRRAPNRAQPCSAASIHLVLRLAQNELPGVSIVADVQPIRDRAPAAGALPDYSPGRPSVHASDDNINPVERLLAGQVFRRRLPPEIPEQVQPVHEDDRLVKSHLRTTEGLAHAVGRRNDVPVLTVTCRPSGCPCAIIA